MTGIRQTSAPASFHEVLVPFIDSLPCPALLADGEGNVTFLNEAMKQHLEAAHADNLSLDRLFPECFAAPLQDADGLQFGDFEIDRVHRGRKVKDRIWYRKLHGWAYLMLARQQEGPEFDLGHAQTARLASLGFMVAGVCHEIGNPLTAIHSTVQFLQSHKEVSAATLERALGNIGDNVTRVLGISRKLNDYTRTGNDERSPIRIDLAIEKALKLVQQETVCSGVSVRIATAPDDYVRCNAERLQQMFANILTNAMQAMNGRGELDIGIARIGANVEVTIADTGPGIAPEYLPRLFKPFFTTKPRGQGTGLGLAICNEIAIEHDGAILAENNPGGGACFRVRLPAHSGLHE